MPFARVNPGDLIQAQNLDQLVDSFNGVAGKGIPIAESSVNDATNYALTVQNLEATNSRALNVLKSDGSLLIRADVNGVALGTPLNPTAGSIQGAALANATVTNAKLASDTARLNLLVNGGFEIWQRGNGPFTATAAWAADRWQLSINSGSLSVSRDAATVDVGSQYSCSFSSTYSGTLNRLIQVLSDLAPQLAGRTVTISARTRTATANALRINIYSDTNAGGGAGAVQATSSTDPGTSTWTTLSATLTLPAGANYLTVRFEFIATVSGNLDNAMLVVGSQYADYAPLHPADDLARCLRYYEIVGEAATTVAFGGYASAGGLLQYALRYLHKAVTPTSTLVGTWVVSNCGQPVCAGNGPDASYIQSNVTAAGMAQFYNGNAGNKITFEANP
jgi:hypothetical protein